MKVTLDIDDRLLREAREHARRTGQPLRAIVEEGLRRVLAAGAPGAGYRLSDHSVGEAAGDDPLDAYSSEDLRDLAYGEPVPPVSGDKPLDAATLLERWRHLPPVDPEALRRDIDRIIDPSL